MRGQAGVRGGADSVDGGAAVHQHRVREARRCAGARALRRARPVVPGCLAGVVIGVGGGGDTHPVGRTAHEAGPAMAAVGGTVPTPLPVPPRHGVAVVALRERHRLVHASRQVGGRDPEARRADVGRFEPGARLGTGRRPRRPVAVAPRPGGAVPVRRARQVETMGRFIRFPTRGRRIGAGGNCSGTRRWRGCRGHGETDSGIRRRHGAAAAVDTFTFDDGQLALEHGVQPLAPKPNDATQPATAVGAQEWGLTRMKTGSGEVEGPREDVSDEAVRKVPGRHTAGVTSSDGRDPVRRDDSSVVERLGPVPRDALEWNVEYGLRKAQKVLPRKVGPEVFDAYKPAAQVVVEQLELCGIRCFRKPPDPLPTAAGGTADRNGSRTDFAKADRSRGSGEHEGGHDDRRRQRMRAAGPLEPCRGIARAAPDRTDGGIGVAGAQEAGRHSPSAGGIVRATMAVSVQAVERETDHDIPGTAPRDFRGADVRFARRGTEGPGDRPDAPAVRPAGPTDGHGAAPPPPATCSGGSLSGSSACARARAGAGAWAPDGAEPRRRRRRRRLAAAARSGRRPEWRSTRRA